MEHPGAGSLHHTPSGCAAACERPGAGRSPPYEGSNRHRLRRVSFVGYSTAHHVSAHPRRTVPLTVFARANGPSIGCVIDGCPPGWRSPSRPPAQRAGAAGTSRQSRNSTSRCGGDPLRCLRGQTTARRLPADRASPVPAHQGLRQYPQYIPAGHSDYTYLHKYGLL